MNNFGRNLALWLIIGVLLIALFNLFQGGGNRDNATEISYSAFINDIDKQQVRIAEIQGRKVIYLRKNGRKLTVNIPEGAADSVAEKLQKSGADVKVSPPDKGTNPFLSALFHWLPIILIIAVWIFFMRQMQSGSGRAMGFGKSRARLLTERTGRVTFEDVAGVDEAKQEVEEVVEFLKRPAEVPAPRRQDSQGRACWSARPAPARRLLARAIAGEANVPFFTISGSDFVEMFVGVGASRVRDMFEQGKKNAPCIIFIDEIDAVGRHRGAGLGGGNDEREQTLNQLLVEMDGFEANEGVILIAATNRPDVLDPALLRPGRFDRQVVVPNPDVVGREKILQASTCAARCRSASPTSTRWSSPAARPAFPALTLPTWSTRRRCWPPARTSAWSPCSSSRRPRTRS